MQDVVSQPLYKRGWFISLAVVVLLGVATLVALPYGLSFGLNKWLRQHGGDEVTIQDVDFNVFTGRATIENLRLSAGRHERLNVPRLDLDVDWLPLFSRQLVVRSVAINGVVIEIEQAADGNLRVGGISLPADGAAVDAGQQRPWGVGIDRIEIENTTLRYSTPQLQLETRLDELRLTGIKTWADEAAPLVVRGALNGAAFSLDGELPPFTGGTGYRGRVRLDGLDLAGFAGLAEPAVGGLSGRLGVDTRLELLQAQGRPLAVSQSGRVSTRELAIRQGGRRVALGELTWQGDVTLQAGDTVNVTADGKLQAAALDLDREGSDVRLAHVEGVELERLVLRDSGDLEISGLSAAGVVLAKAAAAEDGAIATLGGLDLDTLALAGGNVALGRLVLRDLVADLRRDSDGQWRVVQVIEGLPQGDEAVASADETVAGPGAPQQAGAVSIEAISMTGDSAVALLDASVRPPFSTRLTITAADIGRIDSASPGTDTPVTLEARTGKHSRIDIEGTLRPFAERPTLDLKSTLKAISLTDLSPYTVATLGYALKSGHLDATSTVNIDAGKLDIDNRLVIRGLEVAAVDNASREKLDAQMSVPLDTALGMLRDKHDTIKLDLPVTGDIDSPDFDISDAVNTAVSKALKKGAMTYLTLALQPYGALITVAKLAGEAAARVRLAPVAFTAGSGVPPADTDEYLARVAGILQDRPELNIKVCGLATEQDRAVLAGPAGVSPTAGGRLPDTVLEPETDNRPPAGAVPPPATAVTDEQLLALATQRAAAVTDHLVGTHSVSASRLVTCQPAIDSEPDAQGRVDLLI